VQAVGTQFNVRERINGDTRVSVLEGRVLLTASGKAAELILGAGEEADIHLDGALARHENAVVSNTVAWRQRRLVFDDAPLAEMITEFNRQNRVVHMRLEGVQGDVHRYDGAFDAADPESFVTLLSREPDLKIERRNDEIVIRPSR
jgi:transmembrane sensor